MDVKQRDASAVVADFAGLNVLVVGEAMLDSYLNGPPGGICREAPVPIVTVGERRDEPGGAANTAVNVSALGARVAFLSIIGADLEGRLLREALRVRGVYTEYVMTHTGRRTIAKHRVTADGQLLVRFDQGTLDPLDGETEEALLEDLGALFVRADAVIVSDYRGGIMTPRVIERLAELQAQSRRLLVIDAKDLSQYRTVGASAVKPNYGEALRLLDLPPAVGRRRAEDIMRHGERLLAQTGAQIAAVTLDTDGAVIIEQGLAPRCTSGRRVPPSRTAGAGDTFISTFALALAAGAPTAQASDIAAAAAGLGVGKEGTVSCTAEELCAYFHGGAKYIEDEARLGECVRRHRGAGRRIVFTNGCFDLLHPGHVAYLEAAKSLGDVLIVGINSDASVRRLKGENRPINRLDDRAQVLAALSCVDHVVPFEGDTAADLVRAIRPEVFVKGGDHSRETLPEAPVVEAQGGTVHILPYLDDRSTTRVIERIRAGTKERKGSHDDGSGLDARNPSVVR